MKNLIRVIAVVLIIATGVVGMGYMLYLKIGKGYRTEMVISTDYSETIDAEVFFIREEVRITSNLSGSYMYSVADGEKVAKDGVIAEVYRNDEQIAISLQLSQIEAEIEQYKELAAQTDVTGVSVDALLKRISTETTQWGEVIRQNDLSQMTNVRVALLQSLCRKQIATGEVKDFSEKLASLTAERKTLRAQYVAPKGQVKSKYAGYFVAENDGYENVLTVDMAKKMTVSMLEGIVPENVSENVVGKVITNHVWYAVCKLDGNTARRLTAGSTLNLVLPSQTVKTTVKVEAINRESVTGDAIVVLKGEENLSEIATLRQESIKLEIDNHYGLKVNREAVHILNADVTTEKDGVTVTEKKEIHGVYIVYGEQVRFCEISPIYWDSNFVICDLGAKATGPYSMLKRYDQIVLGGKDLYDGKYIG